MFRSWWGQSSNAHEQSKESERLLDDDFMDVDSDESSEELFEVVVHAPKQDKDISLQEKLDECIQILQDIQDNIPHRQNQLKRERILQVALILGGVGLAISSPATLIGLIVRHWHDLHKQLLAGWEEKLSDLNVLLMSQTKEHRDIYAQRDRTLSAVVGSEVGAWFMQRQDSVHVGSAYQKFSGSCNEFILHPWRWCYYSYDGLNGNCGGGVWHTDDELRHLEEVHDVYEKMCVAAERHDHILPVCNDIAKSACDKVESYMDSHPDFKNLSEHFTELAGECSETTKQIEYVENCIDGGLSCDEVVSEWSIPLMGIVGGGALAASFFLLSYLYLSKNGFNEKMESLQNESFNDMELGPREAIKLMWVVTRLGLDIGNVTVSDLKQTLIEQGEAIQERAARRVAFLSAKYDPNSTACFFMRSADRNVKKMIFEHAELQPSQTVSR
jgi:hypothetical protein